MGVSRSLHHQSYHNHHRLIRYLSDFDLLRSVTASRDRLASIAHSKSSAYASKRDLVPCGLGRKRFGESRVDMPQMSERAWS